MSYLPTLIERTVCSSGLLRSYAPRRLPLRRLTEPIRLLKQLIPRAALGSRLLTGGPGERVPVSFSLRAHARRGEYPFVTIYPAEWHTFGLPVTISRGLPRDFRLPPTICVPPAGIAVLPDGPLLGTNGAVAGREGTIVLDVSPTLGLGKPVNCYRGSGLPRPRERLPGAVATVASPGAGNFYHFLFDLLPRLHLLEVGGYDESTLDSIVINPIVEPFLLELLGHFSFPTQIYRETTADYSVVAESLIVPTLPRQFVRGNWVYRSLRERFRRYDEQSGSTPRVYISRARAAGRRLRKTARFRRILRDRGFDEVILEELAFIEQVQVVAQADVVMGDHGAGLSHIVFCKPDAQVIEILSPAWPRPHFWAIASQLDLRYYCLFGDRPVRSVRARHWGHTADFWVGEDQLERLLDQVELERLNRHPG